MIFAMDPSLAAFGWARLPLDGPPEAMGCVKTEKDAGPQHLYRADDDGLRVDAFASVCVREMRGRPVRLIASEAPAGAQHAAAAKALGLAYGCVRGIGCALGIRVVTVQAHEPRVLLCGTKGASKADVQAALEILYPTALALLGPKPSKVVREGAFDALAVAHTVKVGTMGDLLRGVA